MKYVFRMFSLLRVCSSGVFAFLDSAELEAMLENESLEDASFNAIGAWGDEAYDITPVTMDTASDYDYTNDPAITTVSAPQDDLVEIISWMYNNGLTTFATVDAFRPDEHITREQMAKFAVAFGLLIQKQRNASTSCGFKDIYQADRTLIPYIISACNMGFLKGVNGKALPTKTLTKAEAVTIIMRAIRNDLSTDANPRYLNYYNTAKAYGITTADISSMEKVATRREIAIMLHRAYKFQE